VIKSPGRLTELAKELAKRHSRVGLCRLRRLDNAYRTMSAAAALSDQAAQEHHIREAVARYFEEVDDVVAGVTGEEADAGKGTAGLPLVACSKFVVKDVRMLLREAAQKVSPALRSSSACTFSRAHVFL
jgi:hypothetical protein